MCTTILGDDLLKDTTIKQLLTELPDIFFLLLLHFHKCFGYSEEALRSPVINRGSTKKELEQIQV
jgi:hypothetical protein